MSYMDVMNGFGSQWTNAQAPPTYTPTYSPQALGQQNQSWLDNLYGGGANGGFGQQTNYYSGLGASYGRATGGFNAAPASAPAPSGGGSRYLSGGGLDPNNGENIAEYYRLMSGGGSPSFDDRWSNVPSYTEQSPNANLPSQFNERDWLHPYQVPKASPPTPAPAYNPFQQYNNGGYDPFNSGSYSPSRGFGDIGSQRNRLADLMRQATSPQAPAVTPSSPQNLYTGNWFGAATNPAAGMAPGMGGFNNPNFNNMQFAPPNQSAVPPNTAQQWEQTYGRAGGNS